MEPFVGRHRELEHVVDALHEAASGGGSLVLVTGEAGIGKTRLVEEAVGRAEVGVRWSACWEGRGAPALWPWIQLVRACGSGEDLLVGARDDDPAEARFALFDSVAAVFRNEAEREPLCLVVDDMQWADDASLQLLRFLAPELRTRPLAVVATVRTGEGVAADLFRVARTVELTGLARDEAHELIDRTTGAAVPPEIAGQIHERAGGNVLFIRELARLLKAQGRLDRAAPLPEGIRAVLGRRLARISQPAGEALTAAAVAGPSFTAGIVEAMTGHQVLELLDEAVAARLVATEGSGRFAFEHALVRQAVLDGIPVSRRAGLHRAAGAALAASPDAAERSAEIAEHLIEAGDPDAAAGHLEIAARRALDLVAYEDAERLFTRGVDAGVSDPVRRTALLLGLGDARLRAGRRDAAAEAFRAAAALARRTGRADQLAEAALGSTAGPSSFEVDVSDPEHAALLDEALRALGSEHHVLRAWLLARLSIATVFTSSDDRRRSLADEAVTIARQSGDDRALAFALSAWCDAHAGPDHCSERLDASAEMVRLGRSSGDRTMELLGRRLRVVALMETGDTRALDAEIAVFGSTAATLRQPTYAWCVPLWRGTRAFMNGDLPGCLRYSDEVASVDSLNARVLAWVQRWCAMWGSGSVAEAARLMGTETPPELEGSPSEPMCRLYPAAFSGRVDEARALLAQHAPYVLDERPLDSEWLPELWGLGSIALEVDDATVAAAVFERLRPYAHLYAIEGIGAGTHGSVAYLLGRLARMLGRPDEADAYLRQAAEADARAGCAAFAERARLAIGATDAGPRTDVRTLRRDGEVWTVDFAGSAVVLKDSKGIGDLARLLEEPGREVHVLDLMGGAALGGTGPVLDRRAVAAYRDRLDELQDELASGDRVRAERAAAERQAIVEQLSSAYGLGGRGRRSGEAAERARAAVTSRIRDAIVRIEKAHPELGKHLRSAVRTGTFCSYAPDQPNVWTVTP